MVRGSGGAIDGVLLVCLIPQDGQNVSGVLRGILLHHCPGPLHTRPAGGGDDLIHLSEVSIVVSVKVGGADLSDVVVFRRNFDEHDAPFGDGANGVAKTRSAFWYRHSLDGVIQRSSLQQGAGDKMPPHAHSDMPGLDVVNGEADALGVETKGIAAEEAGIRKGGERGLTLDFGVDEVHVASKRWRAILVVADQRRVVCDQGTVGTAAKVTSVFPPHVDQEERFGGTLGPISDPLKFGEVVGIASLVQFQELLVSRLSLWRTVVGQGSLLEERVGIKRAANLVGKPLTDSESNLIMRTAGLKLFNHSTYRMRSQLPQRVSTSP